MSDVAGPVMRSVGKGPHSCAECLHRRMRTMQIGTATITIGRPELQCRVDGSYRSPELKRDCSAFERA